MACNEYDGQMKSEKDTATLESAIAQYSQRYSQGIHNYPDCELRGAIDSIGLALAHLSRDRYNAGSGLLPKLLNDCKESLEAELNRRDFVAQMSQAL